MKKIFAILISAMVVMTILASCGKTNETPNTDNQNNQNQNNNNETTIKANMVKITIDTSEEISDVKLTYTNGGDMERNNRNDNANSDDNANSNNGDENNGNTGGNASGMISRGDVLEYTIDKTAGAGGFTVMVYDKAGKEIATKTVSANELNNAEETIMLRITDKTAGGGIEITESTNASDNDQNNNQNDNQNSDNNSQNTNKQ